ncbi:DUF4386 family protein [Nocardia sp. NPDC050710]|uniref:DUF4386 family protein n=1 Tax=Nocardia sp. NPDC050710 TaxID=3157220 RepID=UPI0033E94B80
MSTRPWSTIALLVAAPITLNLAFAGLGSAFDYPDILHKPGAEVLELFRADQDTIALWFGVLAVAALAMAPLSILVGRLHRSATMRVAVYLGMAAAVVQAVGLLRWPLLVPTLAARAATEGPESGAVHTFELLSTILGTTLGETCGYALTAAWTACTVTALRARLPRWFTVLGYASALLIATGVPVPLGISALATTNFIGYVLWSGWLLAFATLLVVDPPASESQGRGTIFGPEQSAPATATPA